MLSGVPGCILCGWPAVMGLNISNGKTRKEEEAAPDIASNEKISQFMKDIISGEIDTKVRREDEDDPFFVVDLENIKMKHKLWKQEFPNVEPFYAVKCNPDTRVLKTLAELGTGFDCASKTEILQVLDLGVPPDRIIYANPCKAESHLRFAMENGVRLMTFDNEEELYKIKQVFPQARLVLRIWAEDKTAVCPLSVKFGCQLHEVRQLLEAAKHIDLSVEGISFHVGSGSGDPESYYTAIQDARIAYDIGIEVGHDLHLIDIGGGFPGKTSPSVPFEKYAAAARRAIAKYFPDSSHHKPRIIGEPGTFYVQTAFSLAVCVIGTRDLIRYPLSSPKDINFNNVERASAAPEVAYYINNNVYSSLKDAFLIGAKFEPKVLKSSNVDAIVKPSILWGNTTSRCDCVRRDCLLSELEEGDWLIFGDMGAYAMAISSEYSGFELPLCYPV